MRIVDDELKKIMHDYHQKLDVNDDVFEQKNNQPPEKIHLTFIGEPSEEYYQKEKRRIINKAQRTSDEPGQVKSIIENKIVSTKDIEKEKAEARRRIEEEENKKKYGSFGKIVNGVFVRSTKKVHRITDLSRKKGKKQRKRGAEVDRMYAANASINRKFGIHNPKPDKGTVLSESRNRNRDYNAEYENTLFVSNTSGTGRHKREEWNSNVALKFSRYLRGGKKNKKRNNLDGVDRGALK